ncbi:MAG: SusC/RagA family TonB-linked outer membrane protein [Haliscomenobacteraceae bacterium CHB4]|nr:TonB-dependent receptor SusC [Saprospiraceae bacterium]MCE7921827.1 SusC/RagA family TonB-linked outer membrane protein [Haliscomenobacteraceae bacterium CHB4]
MKFLHTFTKGGLLAALLLLLGSAALAQRTVTGKVTDAETGEPLIGATVSVVGTTRGSVTDIDGNYSVIVPDGSTQLRFAYTGYKEEVVELSSSNTVDMAMKPGTVLDEIVVIGYGAVKKEDATGAVATISSKDFNRGVIVAPEQLIQGQVAGVQVTTASGEPGAGINVRIRGTTSVRSGNNPLFVLDGIPLSGGDTQAAGADAGFGTSSPRNPLNFINPDDIANIDILKDASATAIYGSRGANGVVIITTKKGQQGKGSLNYNYSLGISNIANKYDLLGREEFLDAYEFFNGAAARETLDGDASTDWQGEVFQTGLTHTHNVSFGGAQAGADYRFSFGYQDQEGIVKESGMKKFNARLAGSKKFINDRLTLGANVMLADITDDNAPISNNSGFEGDLMGAMLKANPSQAVKDAMGKFIQPSNTEPNPAAMLEYTKDFTKTLRSLGGVTAEFSIVDGLSFKTILGYDRSLSNRKSAYSRLLNVTSISGIGRLFTGDVEIDNRLWENYFTYTKTFGVTTFTGVLGYSYQNFDYTFRGAEYANFRTDDLDLMINNLASANQGKFGSAEGTNSIRQFDELQSYFGRFNFDISDKYLVTLTVRRDGSTRFGGDNRYGTFPSLAAKWRLGAENFMPESLSGLSLRLGWGITGNQEIPHNLYQPRQRYNDWDINNGGDNVEGGGLNDVAFANPELKWETSKQLNFGLDFAFAQGRVVGSLDLYKKNTDDLLIQVTSAQPAVSPFVWRNLDADIENKGVELGLNVVAVDNGKFSWDVNFNISYNKNEVKDFAGLINTGGINGQGLSGAFAQRIAQGQPLFAFFVRDFAGYDDAGISVYNDGDFQQFIGSPLPTVYTGMGSRINFSNIDFGFNLYGQFGNKIYNNTANAFFTAGSLANGRNVTSDVPGNGESNLNAPDVSTRFLEDGGFVRIQNITLGYTLQPRTSAISSVRFFVQGQNLAVFTNYTGQDPEVNINKAIDGVPSLGIDYTAYPRARTFLVGASVSF